MLVHFCFCRREQTLPDLPWEGEGVKKPADALLQVPPVFFLCDLLCILTLAVSTGYAEFCEPHDIPLQD